MALTLPSKFRLPDGSQTQYQLPPDAVLAGKQSEEDIWNQGYYLPRKSSWPEGMQDTPAWIIKRGKPHMLRFYPLFKQAGASHFFYAQFDWRLHRKEEATVQACMQFVADKESQLQSCTQMLSHFAKLSAAEAPAQPKAKKAKTDKKAASRYRFEVDDVQGWEGEQLDTMPWKKVKEQQKDMRQAVQLELVDKLEFTKMKTDNQVMQLPTRSIPCSKLAAQTTFLDDPRGSRSDSWGKGGHCKALYSEHKRCTPGSGDHEHCPVHPLPPTSCAN
jgi:hypothetical protein